MTYNYNGVDSKPLTPNPLRFGRRLNINYFNESSTSVEMNRLVEMNDFTELWTKKLWTKEYFRLLHEQHSYIKSKNNLERDTICVGDIISVSENTPRMKWTYKLVEELI